MATLFEIGEDVIALDALLGEIGGDVTVEEVEKALDQWFAECENNLHRKLDAYGNLIAELEGRAAIRKQHADRLYALVNRDSKNAERLRNRLYQFLTFMGYVGKKKIETGYYSLGTQKNGGRPPLEVDLEPRALPSAYQRLSVSIAADSEYIRQRLAAGAELTWARIKEAGTHLRIR